jgi:hypothetical protein
VLFVWDGIVSCLRQWSLPEWAETQPTSIALTPVSVVATYVTERRTAHAQPR